MKNTLDGINGRLGTADTKINELEGVAIETIQNEKQKNTPTKQANTPTHKSKLWGLLQVTQKKGEEGKYCFLQ